MSNWDQRSRGNYGNENRGRGGGDGGQQQSYPNSGALFPVKQKRSDNSPDVTGNIVISDDVLDYILREAQDGNEVKLDLSGWIRTSRSNMTFTSVKINIPYDVRMTEQGNPVYRQPSPRPQQGRRDERQAYSQPQSRGNSYARETGRDDGRGDPRGDRYPQDRSAGPREVMGRDRHSISDEDFKRGDSMPDFLRSDDDDEIPFDV